MRAHVLVPVKTLGEAKSRLAASLSTDERVALMQQMLDHVLWTVREAAVGPVTVVSAESLALGDVARFDDRGLEWNDALEAAMREAVSEPIATVISADLPFLRADEVRALVAATPGRGIAIARAKDGGTNAVSMRPPAAVRTCFGETASARLHAELAAAAGLEHAVVDLAGLAFDVDTAADLKALRAGAAA